MTLFGLGNIEDFGARNLDKSLMRWWGVDEMSEKYSSYSPYNYVVNNPVRVIDPNGKDIILLFYASGQKGSKEFQKAAETRKNEIENNKDFNSKKDKVFVVGYDKVEQIKDYANNAISKYGEKYGKTSEVGIWSHASSVDGPIGRLPNDNFPAGERGDSFQMSDEGWSKINFNFKEDGAKINFFGCNTCSVKNNNSFGKRLSSMPNFGNVEVSGQPYSAYLSERSNTFYNPSGKNADNAYFVSQKVENLTPISKVLPLGVYPMKTFKNGILIK